MIKISTGLKNKDEWVIRVYGILSKQIAAKSRMK